MKKLLITGFDPFGGEPINPSWEAVRLLPDKIGAFTLTKLQIPTVFDAAAQQVILRAEAEKPHVILAIGQAGGRSAITPEVVGINLREASIADNAGILATGQSIDPDGPAAYFATVPVRDMVEKIRSRQLPANLSYSAGAFVCNDVLYTLLRKYSGTQTLVGFIHVPFLPQQAKEGVPSLTLEQIVSGLTAAIEALA